MEKKVSEKIERIYKREMRGSFSKFSRLLSEKECMEISQENFCADVCPQREGGKMSCAGSQKRRKRRKFISSASMVFGEIMVCAYVNKHRQTEWTGLIFTMVDA